MNSWFLEALAKHQIQLSEQQKKQFEIYKDFLLAQNQVMNLTAITDVDQIYKKHFYDSIMLFLATPLENQSLLDVGSGAGFPSVPLKIVFPHLQVHLIDALQKRVGFLMELITKCQLQDITATHIRAEDCPRDIQYNIVTSRAVSKLPILAELCLPFVAIGGTFLAMKSIHYQEELDQSQKAIQVLGGRVEKVIRYELDESEQHVIIVIRKIQATPKCYPRSFAKIKVKPL